jgi:hypothetical protein
MGIDLPNRLANGVGNPPDALKQMENWDTTLAQLFGNFLLNAGLELWTSATSFSNPANAAAIADSWTNVKSGTSSPTVDVSREASLIDTETYALKGNITGAGSSNSIWGIKQSITSYSRFGSETIIFTANVRCGTASKARLKVTDGTTTAYSSYHTGSGTYEKLQAVLTVGATPSELSVYLEVTSDFTGAVYIDSCFVNLIPALMSSTARAALSYRKFLPTSDYVTSINSSATAFPTSTNYGDAANILLTAGDWDLAFNLEADNQSGACTWSRVDIGISTTSGNDATGLNLGDNFLLQSWASSNTTPTRISICLPAFRVSINSPTTYYGKIRADYTVSNPRYYYRLSARRVR